MTVGDAIEIAIAVLAPCGVLLVIAGLVSWIVAAGAALLMLCVVLGYLAQVWAATKLSTLLRRDLPEDTSDAGQ